MNPTTSKRPSVVALPLPRQARFRAARASMATSSIPAVSFAEGRVLRAIANRKDGLPTTTREVARELGFASFHAAYCSVVQLRRKGLVTWEERKGRTLRATELGREFAELIAAVEGMAS